MTQPTLDPEQTETIADALTMIGVSDAAAVAAGAAAAINAALEAYALTIVYLDVPPATLAAVNTLAGIHLAQALQKLSARDNA